MKKRIIIKQLEPNAYKAMMGMEEYLNSTDLSKNLRELIKIRASQINGCAYCLDMHTKDAIDNGENQRRIFVLNAWKESDLFDSKERVVLKMTEEITLISNQGLSEETYEQAKKFLTENEIAQIIMQVSVTNAWNRIAVATHLH